MKRQYLTNDELNKLVAFKGDEKLELARDTFLLMYYICGAKFSEIVAMTNRNYLKECFYYVGTRQVVIHYTDRLNEVIDRYLNPDKMDDYVLPYMKGYKRGTERYAKKFTTVSALINKHLAEVAKQSGIDIRLTTSCARITAIQKVREIDGEIKAQIFACRGDYKKLSRIMNDPEGREVMMKAFLESLYNK